MRIFVYEFVTGGGMVSQELPEGLVREADLMVRALVRDLGSLPGIRVVTSRDPRLPPIDGCEMLPITPEDLPTDVFGRGLAVSDAAWPIAPESGGVLEDLAHQTLKADRPLLGCGPDVVRLAASKSATSIALREAGISAVPSWRLASEVPRRSGRWVVKPDDGAGCEDTWLVPDWSAARTRLLSEPSRLIAQPWVEGEALSLSLLCADGQARLLSVNRQEIRIDAGRLSLAGLQVNALSDSTGRFAALGSAIAAALPSLWGYVGVDLIDADRGAAVLEINPRLTTSYSALREALGMNVAELVLALREPGAIERWPAPASGRPASITLVSVRES